MVDPATKTSFRRLSWKESSNVFDKNFPQKCWQLNTFIFQASKTSFCRYKSRKSLETIFFRFLKKNVESDKIRAVCWLMQTLLPRSFCFLEHFASKLTLLINTLCSSSHFAPGNTLLFRTLYSLKHFNSWNKMCKTFLEAKSPKEKSVLKSKVCVSRLLLITIYCKFWKLHKLMENQN